MSKKITHEYRWWEKYAGHGDLSIQMKRVKATFDELDNYYTRPQRHSFKILVNRLKREVDKIYGDFISHETGDGR